MTETTQEIWDRFERWAKRYKQICFKEIDRLCDTGWYDTAPLYLIKPGEFGTDIIADLNLDVAELKGRISQRIQFIRAYLADISFDGDEFMSMHSRFLHRQYPGASQHSLGVWLEQSMEDPIEAGSSFLFQDFDISFFIKDFSDIDLASMRSILPFDTMYLLKPSGDAWNASDAQKASQNISYDLDHDGYVQEKSAALADNFLQINFKW